MSSLAHRPVHLRAYIFLTTSLLVFTVTLGWGQAERQRAQASMPGIGGDVAEPVVVAPPSQLTRAQPISRSGVSRPAPLGAQLGEAFVWPVLAPVSSSFGIRDGRPHRGVDLAANHGDSIRAAMSGTVVVAGALKGYGQTVILEHPGGFRTLYAHSSVLQVSVGQHVKQGQLIARVGSTGESTGPHLHFEIMMNDRHDDPLLYLPERKLR